MQQIPSGQEFERLLMTWIVSTDSFKERNDALTYIKSFVELHYKDARSFLLENLLVHAGFENNDQQSDLDYVIRTLAIQLVIKGR